jgi:hypothetical protein
LHHPPWPATNAAAASAAATAAAAVSAAATAAGRRPRCRPCTSARPCSPRSRCPCPGCAKASGRVWRWRSSGSTPDREQWSSPGKWRITSAPPTLVCLTSSDTRLLMCEKPPELTHPLVLHVRDTVVVCMPGGFYAWA